MKKKFDKSDLIEILIKKAKGYYYSDEVYEYEKTQNKTKVYEKQLSFDDYDNNSILDDRGSTNTNPTYDIMKLSNEKPNLSKQGFQNLTLAKKKITTHFVPPDMLAIKILFEIFGEKVDENDIEKLSDEELIKLKNKLIGEIKNDDCTNN